MAETMHAGQLTLLNTSIITSYGTYRYDPLTLDEACTLVREFQQQSKGIQSAIGHQSTAELLTLLLQFPVAVNRSEFQQAVDSKALVFKLKRRPSEGKILSREEIETLGYEFGLLVRIA